MIGYEAKIASYGRNEAATTHCIRVTSPRMVAALAEHYGVTQRKTATLGRPNLAGERAAAFLRGYIDGDGCVGLNKVGRAK